jgi:polyhydroxyalkanoate synthesis repressor PhaR
MQHIQPAISGADGAPRDDEVVMSDTVHAVESSPRVIKRYSNRKLYDTKASSYVTLLNIADMVRAGETIQIVDNATKEDKTDVTLALIISEELKARPREIPLATLKALIRSRGGRLMTQLREGALGKLLLTENDEGERGDEMATTTDTSGKGSIRATLEQWQSTIDERVRAILPSLSGFQELQKKVDDLTRRIEELEKRPPSH